MYHTHKTVFVDQAELREKERRQYRRETIEIVLFALFLLILGTGVTYVTLHIF